MPREKRIKTVRNTASIDSLCNAIRSLKSYQELLKGTTKDISFTLDGLKQTGQNFPYNSSTSTKAFFGMITGDPTLQSYLKFELRDNLVYIDPENCKILQDVGAKPEKRDQQQILLTEEDPKTSSKKEKISPVEQQQTTQEVRIPSKDKDPKAFYMVKAISQTEEPQIYSSHITLYLENLKNADEGHSFPHILTARSLVLQVNALLKPYNISLSALDTRTASASKPETQKMRISKTTFDKIKAAFINTAKDSSETCDTPSPQDTADLDTETNHIGQALVTFAPPHDKSPEDFIKTLCKTNLTFEAMELVSCNKLITTNLLRFEETIKEFLGPDFANDITQQNIKQHINTLSGYPLFLSLIQSLQSINVTIKNIHETESITYNLLDSHEEALAQGLITPESISLINALKQIKENSIAPQQEGLTSDSQNVNSIIEIMRLATVDKTEEARGTKKIIFTVANLKETAKNNSIIFPYPNSNSANDLVLRVNKNFNRKEPLLRNLRKAYETKPTAIWIDQSDLDSFKVTKPSSQQLKHLANHPLIQAILKLEKDNQYQYDENNHQILIDLKALKKATIDSDYSRIITVKTFLKKVRQDQDLNTIKFDQCEVDNEKKISLDKTTFTCILQQLGLGANKTESNPYEKPNIKKPTTPTQRKPRKPKNSLSQEDTNAIGSAIVNALSSLKKYNQVGESVVFSLNDLGEDTITTLFTPPSLLNHFIERANTILRPHHISLQKGQNNSATEILLTAQHLDTIRNIDLPTTQHTADTIIIRALQKLTAHSTADINGVTFPIKELGGDAIAATFVDQSQVEYFKTTISKALRPHDITINIRSSVNSTPMVFIASKQFQKIQQLHIDNTTSNQVIEENTTPPKGEKVEQITVDKQGNSLTTHSI